MGLDGTEPSAETVMSAAASGCRHPARAVMGLDGGLKVGPLRCIAGIRVGCNVMRVWGWHLSVRFCPGLRQVADECHISNRLHLGYCKARPSRARELSWGEKARRALLADEQRRNCEL